MKTKQKKGGRKTTVMTDMDTIESCCLAELGKGNMLIRTKYNIDLSDGQLSYRLKKAKTAAGMKAGDGFRKAWREGRSPYEDMVRAVLPELKKDYERNILPQVEKPTIKVAPNHDGKADGKAD